MVLLTTKTSNQAKLDRCSNWYRRHDISGLGTAAGGLIYLYQWRLPLRHPTHTRRLRAFPLATARRNRRQYH